MLALIAGEGALPGIVRDAYSGELRVCELEGHRSELREVDVTHFRIERLGSFIQNLKSDGITKVCFAGAIARPALDPSLVDPPTMKLVPRLMQALQSGDDGALRAVIEFFEEAGLTVVASHELATDLLPAPGVLSHVEPSAQDEKDAVRGDEILAAMGGVDLGQACVVVGGQALALETIAGTDWMMRSLLHRDAFLPKGGLFMKASKPAQDRRIDMPTIGPDTFARAAEVGLSGVVIEAGGVQVLSLERCLEIANTHNLLFWVR
ncbi:MAG: UDP-2,3-diacylglucosamine diphosphatase LpxI [Litoreibacter sp.]